MAPYSIDHIAVVALTPPDGTRAITAAAAAADADASPSVHHLAAATQHASDDCALSLPPAHDFIITDALETSRAVLGSDSNQTKARS